MSNWIVTVTVATEDGPQIMTRSQVRLACERPEAETVSIETISGKTITTMDDLADRDILQRLITKAGKAALESTVTS